MANAAGAFAVAAHTDHRDAFFDDRDNRRLGLVQSYQHGRLGRLEMPGAFLHFGARPATGALPPPDVGEHSVSVLDEIGLADETAKLVRAGGVHDGAREEADRKSVALGKRVSVSV